MITLNLHSYINMGRLPKFKNWVKNAKNTHDGHLKTQTCTLFMERKV